MFAIADCNNFYVSCQRLFEPQYIDKPVVVLSNNDGCVIARSNEVKALGIPMGIIYDKIYPEVQHFNIKAYSSNYALYADMSARVMQNLARFSPSVEVYSIDECFLDLSGFKDLHQYTNTIRDTVVHNTGIPISIGVAATKTLAKAANKLAKKQNGTLVLDQPEAVTTALEHYPVEDLWGIGGQYTKKLQSMNIHTAQQFRSLPLAWVEKNMTVTGARTWRELWGQSCIPLITVSDPKQIISTAKGFGKVTNDYAELREATTNYTTRLAEKLRKEKLCTSILHVRLIAGRFKKDEPLFCPCIAIPLHHPVNNTIDLVRMAQAGLRCIFKKNHLYQKVEITFSGLLPEAEVQLHLFAKYQGEKFDKVSTALDHLNQRFGKGTVKLASEGKNHRWAMKRKYLSPNYTTHWDDIIEIH
ncbi:SOS mutagenesis and repair protein UmuC [Pedobacter sp. HMWF019]|uniref:Y-family DNA polymerase n=1 Tax=Pedobacter sp. HMWF019 TaxID=2056856 RepID=UPI000D3C5007|nr:Y-family DNA polymerase [Pedobacter sp. HMWF019]PTS95634.1 SOS mutagenesis and repair protein UmuC [Pedobacter sp. HMWF019]